MPTDPLQKYRLRLAFVIVLATAGGAFAALARSAGDPVVSEDAAVPGLVTCELRGFRYEYHAPTGRANLYDLKRDPNCATDVSAKHAGVVLECRRAVELSFGIDNIESLRARYSDVTSRLRALGYL
jgi:hypothetical protein